jgi:hypothetical protein
VLAKDQVLMADEAATSAEVPVEAVLPAVMAADVVTDVPEAVEAVTAELVIAVAAVPDAPVKPRRGRKPKVAAEAAPAVKASVAKPRKVKPTVKAAAPKIESDTTKTLPISQLKEKIMATKKTTDFTASLTDVVSDVQEKAKAAFEKSTASLGEAGEFAKGNVEALVESGKIFAEGLKGMGETIVAEGKSAFEVMSADAKELAAVKSPADFFKLQGELMRRNFDSMVAFGSKNTEAVMKLAGDAATPISSRVSLAMEKAKKAA